MADESEEEVKSDGVEEAEELYVEPAEEMNDYEAPVEMDGIAALVPLMGAANVNDEQPQANDGHNAQQQQGQVAAPRQRLSRAAKNPNQRYN